MMDPILVILTIALAVVWAVSTRRRAKVSKVVPVDDGPEGEPYRIYTTAFDRIIAGTDLPAALTDPNMALNALSTTPYTWEGQLDAARTWPPVSDATKAALRSAAFVDSTIAVSFLIDQSGSLRGNPMAAVARAIGDLVPVLTSAGLTVEVLGHGSCGWRGGRARAAWRANGRPPRPGRLCALLHIVYMSAGEKALADAAWEAMLHPALLCENVDGEALLWAAERLRQVEATRRILVTLGDGFAMDDSTANENGVQYLQRHRRLVMDRLAADPMLEVVTVNCDGDAAALAAFPETLAAQLIEGLSLRLPPASA